MHYVLKSIQVQLGYIEIILRNIVMLRHMWFWKHWWFRLCCFGIWHHAVL